MQTEAVRLCKLTADNTGIFSQKPVLRAQAVCRIHMTSEHTRVRNSLIAQVSGSRPPVGIYYYYISLTSNKQASNTSPLRLSI